MELVTAQLINGILTGSVYALIAVGLTLIFGVMRAVNFAHGDYYMLGAVMAYFALAGAFQAPYWLAIIVGTLLVIMIGLIASVTIMERLVAAPIEMAVLATVGIQLILQNGARLFWGTAPRTFPGGIRNSLNILGVGVSGQRLLILVIGAVLFTGLHWLVRFTRIGKAMRAVAQNKDACLVVGINVRQVARFTFVLGIGLAALAGSLVGPVLGNVATDLGLVAVVKSFAVIALGGLGNVGGALVGALVIGISEAFIVGFVSLQFRDAVAFTALILVFMIKPDGVFGVRGRF